MGDWRILDGYREDRGGVGEFCGVVREIESDSRQRERDGRECAGIRSESASAAGEIFGAARQRIGSAGEVFNASSHDDGVGRECAADLSGFFGGGGKFARVRREFFRLPKERPDFHTHCGRTAA